MADIILLELDDEPNPKAANDLSGWTCLIFLVFGL